jgi:hypothetical protein
MRLTATLLLLLCGCRVDGEIETEDADVTVAVKWCHEFRQDEDQFKRCKAVLLDWMEAKGNDPCSAPDSHSSSSD